MPQLSYFRTWCKQCQDWELHYRKIGDEENNLTCKECKSIYTTVTIGEIPRKKIIEQRERYTAKNKSETSDLFGKYLLQSQESQIMDMFREPGYNTEIEECDAGQEKIDDERKRLRDIDWAEEKRVREEKRIEALKYAHLSRNDKCACGSGLKFKKCHLPIIEKY